MLEDGGFRIARTYGIGLPIVCYRLKQSAAPNSRLARLLEPLSNAPRLSWFCADIVIVARAK